MTRQELIDRFQQWLDTNPDPSLIAPECANIAQEYARELIPTDAEIESMYEDFGLVDTDWVYGAIWLKKQILEKL